jgi:hypothetical protein
MESGFAIKLLSSVGVAIVAAYYLLIAIDRVGIPDREAPAIILAKEHRDPAQGSVTQIINNRPVVVPQSVPEMFVLRLELDGSIAEIAVPQALYDRAEPNTTLDVRYKRGRLFSGLRNVVPLAMDPPRR